ncbi:MAG TPA: thioredoxin domain-containing protein [Candidatus Obscuribacterales bacterium]
MKEILIAFLIALVLGSILNSMREQQSGGSSSTSSQEQAKINENIKEVDESNFESEVADSAMPVLVDFYADTNLACVATAPVLAEIANEYKGAVKVVKIDVLRSPRLAHRYEVHSTLPALMVFKGGRKEAQQAGPIPKEEIVALIKPYLEADKASAD